MGRKKGPLGSLDVEDQEAKSKVSLVLDVLAGEKSISEACRQTGIQPMQYYKLEERMVRAMLAAATLKPGRGRRKDPLAEASALATETDELRKEHRRLKSLVRVSKKLFKTGRRKPRKTGPRGPKPGSPSPLAATEPRKPGRPALTATTAK